METDTSCIINIPATDDINADETTPLLTSLERNGIKEQVLKEVFQEKCTISVQSNEILYVQQNVECFVSGVIQKVVESEIYQNFIHTVDRKGLIQFTEHFREDHLLNSGSFYEGTKNNYPDEFDFIFILAECAFEDNKRLQILTSDLSDLFHVQFQDILPRASHEFGEVFEQCSYTGLHGPASKIKLVFKESINLRDRTIYVDISAASKVRLGASLPKELKICYDEWKEMIIKTGSFLVIKVYKTDHPKHETGVKFTITETEQYFVRYEMSEKHRNVYRLLKYIFNGNDADEVLKKLVRRPDNTQTTFSRLCYGKRHDGPKIVYDLPSYTIKTLMFHHVHQCQNAENGIAECLTEVLRNLSAVFNEKIDNYSTVWQASKGTFAVSVKTMLGQLLEIADDYVSAAVIGKRLSMLIETVENVEQTREAKRFDLDDQIPFTNQNINTVKNVLDSRVRMRRPTPPAAIALIVILIILVVGTITGVVIVFHLKSQACYTISDAPSNKSIDVVQYCCAGTKYSADIWRNVTCLKSNTFWRHPDDSAKSSFLELKQAFACMVLTVAQNGDINDDNGSVDYASIGVTLCEVNESKNIEGICLHCNASIQDSWYVETLLRNEDQELGLYTCEAPCHLDTLYRQVVSFLNTKAHTLEDKPVLVHYYCKTDKMCRTENLTADPLQTEENTAREYRTEICSGNTNGSGSYQPSDECTYYTNVQEDMTGASQIAMFIFGLSAFIRITRKSLVAIRAVKKLRRSMTTDAGTSIQRTN